MLMSLLQVDTVKDIVFITPVLSSSLHLYFWSSSLHLVQDIFENKDWSSRTANFKKYLIVCVVQMFISRNHKRVKVLNANKRYEFSPLCLMERSRDDLIPQAQSDFSGKPFLDFLLNVCSSHLHFPKTIM